MPNPRLDLLPEYPFPRLRRLLDHLATPAGLGEIWMSIGEPQHAYPALVAETMAANSHLYHKYPPNEGTPELRQAIADWLTRRYRLPAGMIAPERHVIPTSGTREGLFMCALAFTPAAKAGRQPAVLMPNPFYQCYAGGAVAAGAEPVYLPTPRACNFLPDLDAIPEALLARTSVFYLCSPANPQGTVADAAYLARLIGLARRFDFVLVMDECYAEIYTGRPPIGALQVAAEGGGALDNLVVFHSLSKRSNVPGLRSGFVAGEANLLVRFLKLREYGGNPMPLPVQATAAALWRDEGHVATNRKLYADKFDLAERVLGNRFGFYRPEGGFFLWLDVGDGIAAARRLWTEAAVRALPGSYLAQPDSTGPDPGHNYLRIAMVPDYDSTAEALRRIAETL
jgi:succinyldiaminopimelate transaminase